jgi:hypothetical protein
VPGAPAPREGSPAAGKVAAEEMREATMNMGWLRKAVIACAATILLSLPAPAAQGSLGIQSLGFSIDSAPPVGAKPGAAGPPEVQAGSHPYQVKASFAFEQTTDANGQPVPSGAAKDLRLELPAGLTGDLADVPHCSAEALQDSTFFSQGCPADAQVGTMALHTSFIDIAVPVFNLEPPPGVPAELGAFAVVTPLFMRVSVRTGSDYGLTVDLHNLPQFLSVFSGSLTLWGVPGDERHDTVRGSCLTFEGESVGSCPSSAPRRAFFTLPGSCEAPLQAAFLAYSWEEPDRPISGMATPVGSEGEALSPQGCDRLDFRPTAEVQAESRTADSPSGFVFDLRFPQDQSPDGLGEAELRDVTATLPGVSIDPATADGLGECLPGEIGLDDATAPRCPDSSRIGSVEIDSPLIADPLRGSIYLAAPGDNPFGSMLAVYLVAEGDGVLVKQAGRIDADPDDGQLTLSLNGMPQLPFSEVELGFDGGPRAPLATPAHCGDFTATTRLTPYSAPSEEVTSTSGFVVDRGCGGGFAPEFHAGATNSLAGRRTGLALRLTRADGEQALRAFSVTLPRGLFPVLAGVPLCPEPGAAGGHCAAASRIGSVSIVAGAGSHPFRLTGEVFITGPYRGAPFGLSIAVPGVAGPFDLGEIVVRARISVDPVDGSATIATDPLPQVLRGIPLRIRGFDLDTAPGFLRAPTSCAAQRVAATAIGSAGAVARIASPFFLSGCAGLTFAPRISASTDGPATRAGGVALRLAIRNPRGDSAGIRAISVDFPPELSPRLSAIQAACPRATFAADPASCPPASIVGRARVRTLILDLPLTGPAYLVSRGTEALPRIVLMLTGQGVDLHIAGSLRISAKDRTVATFASVPDAPISSLVLDLPRGPHAVLGASFLDGARGTPCGRSLAMPVEVVSQSGSRVQRPVTISVSDCAAASRRR